MTQSQCTSRTATARKYDYASKIMPQQDFSKLSESELLEALTAEMRSLHANRIGMRLEIEPSVAFSVVAMCQLGLRHPQAGAGAGANRVREFIEYARAKFEPFAPAVSEAIRRGDDSAHDHEPREQAPA